MKYRLGTIDQGFLPTEVTVSYVALCTGRADEDLLREAFAHTCRRYPMLGGRIEFIDGDCHLDIPDHGSVAVDTVDGDVSDWLAYGVRPIDPTVALAKLAIVRDGDHTAVALRLCHAISDAHLGFEILDEFWRAAAALDTATTIPDAAPIFPRSLEDLLADRGVALPEPTMPELTGLHSFAPSPQDRAPGLRLAPAARITLSDRETSALLHYARAQGTTLHALLSAAVIRAERTMIDETCGAPGTELPMVIAHAVDLRPHLNPPARRTDATNGLGCAPTVTCCTPDSDLTVLAKEAKAQIVDGIDNGTALATMLAASHIPETGVRDYAANIITNWGVVPPLPSPKALRITDFRGFVTGTARPEISYFAYTFQGRLNIEFTYDRSRHPAPRIAELSRTVAANLNLLTAG
ncbi:phthiocerol/phthiodiolone dimycocerosyl transferase family protein [Nocardia heshunensis]